MFRHLPTAVVFATLVLTAPALALTAKQKMETCKFGADDQKLQGAARNAFMKKCMSDKDEPHGATGAPSQQKN